MAAIAYPSSVSSSSNHPTTTMSSFANPKMPANAASATATAATTDPELILRRAVYVHVSDLTSDYNVDHVILEEELRRVQVQEAATGANAALAPTVVAASAAAKTVVAGDHRGTTTLRTAASAVSSVIPANWDATSATRSNSTEPKRQRLQPPRTGFNLCVLVGKVSVVVDKKRVDGSRVRLAEVEVGDETGVVSLRARDDQIDILEEVSLRSGAVVIRNCSLELYLGRHIRLAISKWGKLSRYPDQIASTPLPPSNMNRKRNFSRIDLSKAASELIVAQYDYPVMDAYSMHAPSSFSSASLMETENQSNRTPNRQTLSGASSSPSRRGGGQGNYGSRRPPNTTAQRTKSAPEMTGHTVGPYGSSSGVRNYGEINASSAYHHYRHPRTVVDNTSFQQQQKQKQQQQALMMHHHRQQQQQQHMYQRPIPPPISNPMHSPHHAYPQQREPMPHHMSLNVINPGIPTSAGTFLAHNPFLAPPIPSSSWSPNNRRANSPRARSSSSISESEVSQADSPGKMNPQAATFDPATMRK